MAKKSSKKTSKKVLEPKKRLRKKPFFIVLAILIILIVVVLILALNPSKAPSCTKDKEKLNEITSKIGFSLGDYKILSGECDYGRGGFVKLKLEKKSSKVILDVYYHFGWCSSGGSDCGFTECIKSYSKTNTDYESIKKVLCGNLDYYRWVDDSTCEGTPKEAYDNATEIKEKCMAGDFEQIIGNQRTISINQNSNRCTGIAEQASFDCLNIKQE